MTLTRVIAFIISSSRRYFKNSKPIVLLTFSRPLYYSTQKNIEFSDIEDEEKRKVNFTSRNVGRYTKKIRQQKKKKSSDYPVSKSGKCSLTRRRTLRGVLRK